MFFTSQKSEERKALEIQEQDERMENIFEHLEPEPPGELGTQERWWAERHEWLKKRGYVMRPRYRPGWEPSWVGTDTFDLDCEDGQKLLCMCMDAVRVSDSRIVAMKRVKRGSDEEKVATFFSNEERSTDPRNHCIPILEVLAVPGSDESVLVMPWMRDVDEEPRFRSIGEILHFFKDILEGLQYMHENHVAHRDCSLNNMVMDTTAMNIDAFHPAEPEMKYDWSGKARFHSRTRCPPRYYLIDFGFSRMYDPSETQPLEDGIRSGGRAPPEVEIQEEINPFHADVFLVGNMMSLGFLDGHPEIERRRTYGLEFLRPLVEDMTQDDPTQRPTMDEVVSRFSELVKKRYWWSLRARAVRRHEWFFLKPTRSFNHVFWTMNMIWNRKTAIPSSKSLQ